MSNSSNSSSAATNPIPVTILCGFLGSGKTTLLKNILQQNHGYKIAVIENEFGEENIDNDILVSDTTPEIVEMSNGCICCNIRGDLQKALADLIAKKEAGTLHFDKVVIETTGVAEPGPVAQTFFLDEKINTLYRLDSVITLVDAVHAMSHLDKHVQVQQQIGFADRIFITKSDISSEEDIAKLKKRIVQINPKASIKNIIKGNISVDNIFDIKGFNLDDKLEIDADFLNDSHSQHTHEHCHDEHCSHDHHHTHHHIDSIQSFVYQSDKAFVYEKLEEFLSSILSVYGEQLLRYKGILYMKKLDRKVILQGVHQIMGSDVGGVWVGKPRNKIVFIGTDLPKDIIIQGLEKCH